MSEISIYAFADEASQDLDGQIRALKRNHLRGVEVRGVNGRNIADLTVKEAAQAAERFRDAGLTVGSIGSPVGKIDIHGDHAAHRETFLRLLEVARAMNCSRLRMFSYYIPKEKDPGEYAQQVIDLLGGLCEGARGSGIMLCHENEKGIFGDNAARCLMLYKALPMLRGVFDPANFIQCGQDTAVAWDMLKPYIEYLHIKDALADGAVVPAGKGIGHVPQIVHEYLAAGGRHMTIEPHLTVFDGLRELERAGEETRTGHYSFPDKDSAFDAACSALHKILESEEKA